MLKRSRKKRSREEIAAHDHFSATVLLEPCLFSLSRPDHKCDGPLDPHHAVEKQFLRTHFSTLGPEKWALIYSPEIGIPLCRFAHDRITTHADYIFFHELPVRAIEFCGAWGIGWRLLRECPSIHAETAVQGSQSA